MMIDLIAGARPNFMKIAPIVRALKARKAEGGRLRHRIIHTGQHYDRQMSEVFFDQLGLPHPDLNLGVGSGSHAAQVGAIMQAYEKVIEARRPAACLVVGDVNSTMACAITAQKLHVPVGHVEAGIRSGDWTMPEEINRLVTDAITNWFFTTSRGAGANLAAAGVDKERIVFVGNTMIDTLKANLKRLIPPEEIASPEPGSYVLLTMHRPANVDDTARFRVMLETLIAAAEERPVIYPAHLRTRAQLDSFADELPGRLHIIGPQPYLQFIWLLKHAAAVVTDSGGVTEEATVLGIPCMTLRDTTERPETITEGTNELLGVDPGALAPAFARLYAGDWKTGRAPERWDGQAGARIVAALERALAG